ncbi:hypothetical protein SK128_002188 [Halocaridina rubra]|uniref:Uncharacterized protein n=1 Tax=Halocaridina rubra TaxID=373956 RepID=A0AAN9AAY7_HALRR
MSIDMVLILRCYIHAERAGLWQQHLQEVQEQTLEHETQTCIEVHFVGDQYDFGLKSLKGDEHQRLPEYVPVDSIKIPDWKIFLSNRCNKANVLSYLASRWFLESSWPNGFCLVLGVNAQETHVMQMEHTSVDELYCPNHERRTPESLLTLLAVTTTA